MFYWGERKSVKVNISSHGYFQIELGANWGLVNVASCNKFTFILTTNNVSKLKFENLKPSLQSSLIFPTVSFPPFPAHSLFCHSSSPPICIWLDIFIWDISLSSSLRCTQKGILQNWREVSKKSSHTHLKIKNLR